MVPCEPSPAPPPTENCRPLTEYRGRPQSIRAVCKNLAAPGLHAGRMGLSKADAQHAGSRLATISG